MVRETAYDDVRHAQDHFRSILESLSRPGRITVLAPVSITPRPQLNTASAFVAFALLDADVSFHLVNMTDDEESYLRANTRAQAKPIESATFVFADGLSPAGMLEGIQCGSLAYPDTAATLVLQVEGLSHNPIPEGAKLTLTGPGIETRASVYAHRLNPDLLLALQARNAEFPLGIDTIITCDDGGSGPPRLLGIPRSTSVSWDTY